MPTFRVKSTSCITIPSLEGKSLEPGALVKLTEEQVLKKDVKQAINMGLLQLKDSVTPTYDITSKPKAYKAKSIKPVGTQKIITEEKATIKKQNIENAIKKILSKDKSNIKATEIKRKIKKDKPVTKKQQ